LNEIVVVGDVHEGINFDIRVDPQTGVSERALDMHRNLARAAAFAIRSNAHLFVILGDLFDRTHVAPIFREYVRNDVIEPLAKAGIKIYILAGNHDQPREFRRGTSIDDFRGYPNVEIFRKPDHRIERIGQKDVCFLIMPFLHPDSLIRGASRGTPVPDEQRLEVGREIIRELLTKYSEQEADARIIFAHYYFEGADLSSTTSPEVEPGEIEFSQSMIPDNIDLAVFGHVHLSQTKQVRKTQLILVGAVEKIDWGEREGNKHFLTIDTDVMKWQFHDLPTRDMLRIRVKLDSNEEDPTQAILDQIPDDVADKMVRLEIELVEGVRRLIQEPALGEKLSRSFDYRVKWFTTGGISSQVPEIGISLLTPQVLLESFVETNFAKHKHREQLLATAKNILKEALEE
jgi:DNA repair exonuclease SbcCD nuclease subunit